MEHATVILLSFGVYTLAIVAVGLHSARFAQRSEEDYFLASRTLGPWVAALSASASSESGWVTLGLVGWAFRNGVQAFWVIPGCLLGFLFNWFVIAAPMSRRSRELGALTVPDFFALHFRERRPLVRSLSVLVILVAMFLYVSAQFAAAGKAFSATFPDLTYSHGVAVGVAIVLVYTVTGGFRAVCWTDFLQALLMVFALVAFPLYLLAGHGLGFVRDQLSAADPALLLFSRDMTLPVFLGFLLGSGALGINLGYPGQPHVLVRFMGLRDERTVHISGLISAVWATLIYWGAVTVGLFARAMTEQGAPWGAEVDGDVGLVVTSVHLLPDALAGLVLAAILAAICSTADSQLVVAASAVASDLVARLRRGSPWRAQMVINRGAVLGLGLLAAASVFNRQPKIFEYVLEYGWAVLGASFGPQVVLALLWRRATYAGCLAGMLTGFSVAILWKLPLVAGSGGAARASLAQSVQAATGIEIYNLTLAFALALVVNALVSLVTRPSPGGAGAADRGG